MPVPPVVNVPAREQVVVVGAGPVGLMTAVELRRGGVEVTVVEQLPEPTGESRASQLNARSMEILAGRGLTERLEAGSPERNGHFGGLPVDVGNVPSPYAGLWKVPQFRTEQVLAAEALRLGARIRRGVRLIGVEESAQGLVLTLRSAARTVRFGCSYLVGCDGGRSTVRAAAGIGFPGRRARRQMLRADVAGIQVPDRRFERHPRGLAVAARRPDGVTRVMVHEFGGPAPIPDGAPTFEELAAAWTRVTGEEIGHGQALWVNAFDDETRQAERYRVGRIMVAGDAAHVHMPVGGQALNVGLQDAVNLGWKLASVVHGWTPDHLLDTYHEERHPVGRAVMKDVEAQTALQFGDEQVLPLRSLLAEILALPSASAMIARRLSGLDVCYPDPRSVTGQGLRVPWAGGDDQWTGEHGQPLVGLRAPWVPLRVRGRPTDLAVLSAHPRVSLVVFGTPRTREILAATRAWSARVRQVVAEVVRESPEPAGDGLAALLVRPDGHIAHAIPVSPDQDGRRGERGGIPGLLTQLERWAGPPAAGRSGTGRG